MATIKTILEAEARAVFELMAYTKSSDCGYPDCWDTCTQLRDRLINVTGPFIEDLDPSSISVERLQIEQTSYTHYVLAVSDSEYDFVVDPTFGQFAYERDTPINVAPENVIDDVVIVERDSYVFAADLNSP